jgi:excisionase family DNA binding protein
VNASRPEVHETGACSRAGGNDWLTAAEAAQYLRLPTVKALYQRVARGQMKALRLGRQMRFRRRDLDALMRPA